MPGSQLVIDRAKSLLEELDAADINKSGKHRRKNPKPWTGSWICCRPGHCQKGKDVIDEIRTLDTTSLTPLDALNRLYSMQQKL